MRFVPLNTPHKIKVFAIREMMNVEYIEKNIVNDVFEIRS